LLGERELILFRPELRQIENLQIKEQLQMIAAKQDSMDAHRDLFYRNFKQNVACCDAYADDISDQIKGKRVVVVAAGPSLDNNIDQLKNCPTDVVVIAVGTVFRLLCQKGIRVDYVIFLDSCIYHQIRGMECNDTPVIVAATADGRVAKNYHGTTYLACQKGYDLAEDYAREHGGQIYETGGSVVTLALDLCIRMKAKSIAFIGLDLAYYDNRAHATGTGKETYNGYEFQKVEGIHGEMLNTSQVFNSYRLWLEERIKKADVTMEVYDATENGAKKKGFIVTTLAEYLSE
jgi:hypothetical protein